MLAGGLGSSAADSKKPLLDIQINGACLALTQYHQGMIDAKYFGFSETSKAPDQKQVAGGRFGMGLKQTVAIML